MRRTPWLLATLGLLGLVGQATGCTRGNDLFNRGQPVDAPADTANDLSRDRGPDPIPEPPTADATPDAPGPDADPTPDMTRPIDGPNPNPDSAPPDMAALDLPPDRPDAGPEAPSVPCGTGKADLTGVVNVDGIAIAADGTFYFSTTDQTDAWIGRIRPGQAPQFRWARGPGARANWGLALDETGRQLYLASVSTSSIQAFDLTASAPVGRNVVTGLVEPNDVTIGRDGVLYFSNQGDRMIYRLVNGNKQPVTRTPIGTGGEAPSALAFGPDGALYAGMRNGGPVVRLVLSGGVETGRSSFGSFSGWANGMVFDQQGRLYVGVYSLTTASRLIRLDNQGVNSNDLLGGGQFAGMAFGRGMLDCRDLYLADPDGPIRRLGTDTPGLSGP